MEPVKQSRNLLLNLHLKLKIKAIITKELPLEGVTCAVNEAVFKAFNVRIEMVAMF
jgi:hypothetical protein